MTERRINKYLYKYKSLGNLNQLYHLNEQTGKVEFADLGLDALSKGMIWFSHLDNLNDPYESQVAFDTSRYFQDLNVYLSSLPQDSLSRNVQQFLNVLKSSNVDDCKKIQLLEMVFGELSLKKEFPRIQMRIQFQKQKLGILSLCEENDNLLMWAYYAKEHNGYCLEFSSSENHQMSENLIGNYDMIFPVIYDDKRYEMCDINPFYSPGGTYDDAVAKERQLGITQKVFCHKSKAWMHEKEWRILFDISSFKMNPYSTGALLPFPAKLTAVYCGARMSEAAIGALKDAVIKGNYGYMPKFKRAKLKKDVFGLEFEDC